MQSPLYAVPQSIVFRAWGGWTEEQAEQSCTRRLLIRNGGEEPVSFRLTLPDAGGCFKVTGACVGRATFDAITSVELAPGGTVSLSVEFDIAAAADASAAEHARELLVRSAYDTLHVPLAAVRDARTPREGEPGERRTAASKDEHWDEITYSDDDDERPPTASSVAAERNARKQRARQGSTRIVGRRLPRPGETVELTQPALVGADADELVFYASLIKDDVANRAAELEEMRRGGGEEAAMAEIAMAPQPEEEGGGAASRPLSPAPPVAPPAVARSPVRVVHVGADHPAARKRPPPPQQPHSPPKPAPVRFSSKDPTALAAAAAQAAQAEEDEELAFYRSFVAAKRRSDEKEAAGAADAARVGGASGSRQASSVRQALEEGTYFIVGGVVTDTRGRELGPAAEVLGPEYAEPLPPPPPPPAPLPQQQQGQQLAQSSTVQRRVGGVGGGDPARDLGALKGAHLGELRNALDQINDGSYSEGLLSPGRRSQLGAKFGAGGGRAAKLDLTQPWQPAGGQQTLGGAGGGAGLGASGSIKVAVKGGGGVVKSTAPKPTVRLSAAEMDANWAALT